MHLLKELSSERKEAVELTTRAPKRRGGRKEKEGSKTQETQNGERARVLAQEGEYSRGLQALTSSGMAPQNRATEANLRAKHPPAPSELGPLPTTEVSPLSVTLLEVEKSVKRFRRGSAPGPSRLRPESVKAALKAPPNRNDKALVGLTKLVYGMMAGKVPATVAPYLCGARLHAAMKKDGGLRPIAVGNLVRRITAKCAASRVADKAVVHLSPLQVGVAVRGGSEAIAHAVREALQREPDKLLLQADFINAFNTLDRPPCWRRLPVSPPSSCHGSPPAMALQSTSSTEPPSSPVPLGSSRVMLWPHSSSHWPSSLSSGKSSWKYPTSPCMSGSWMMVRLWEPRRSVKLWWT